MPNKFIWKPERLDPLLKDIEDAVIKIGFDLEGNIKKSFKRGTGRKYKVSKTGPLHVASRAGQPPAVDTGRLRASITTNWSGSGMERGKIKAPVNETTRDDAVSQPGGSRGALRRGGKFTVAIGTNLEYAPPLEFGTSKMGARPFLRPALEKIKPRIEQLIKRYARNT